MIYGSKSREKCLPARPIIQDDASGEEEFHDAKDEDEEEEFSDS